jgi:hypothetical protein
MRNTSGLPDICEYTIYMSNKQNSGGSGTKIGLNICAIGTPQSYSLDIIPPQNYLFYVMRLKILILFQSYQSYLVMLE